MKSYEKYRDSGVQWIGEIPSHWDTIRIKDTGFLYGGLTGKSGDDFRNEGNPTNRPFIPFTNIFRNTYISPDNFGMVVINDGENQNRVQKNDLFFLMSSEDYEDLGKTSILIHDYDELYLNSFCKGLRITNEDVYPLFLNYQLSGYTHKKLISVEGSGFTRINLRQDKLTNTPVLLPPLSEQHQIVSFLDEKTSLIDDLINKKEQKIGLLKEYRTSLINRVITKGLNPDCPMKDSGVQWIGMIPSHWESIPMKYMCSIGNGKDYSHIQVEEGGYPVLGTGGEFARCSDYLHTGPSVLLGRKGTIDNPLFINEPFWTSDTLYFTIIGPSVLPMFLYHSVHQIPFDEYEYGSTIPSMTKTQYENMRFPLPPLPEQEQIVSFLDEKTSEIDRTIQSEQKKIELLKEYRQSLISSVITGKIKVVN